jgi:hypothetical protein
MKIWEGFGSEHSAKLVMIGRFESADKARLALEKIKSLCDLALREYEERERRPPKPFQERRFSGQMLELLNRISLHSLQVGELEQFIDYVNYQVENDRVVIRTDEIDVSAFFKVLINEGARVEIFSSHVHQDADEDSQEGSSVTDKPELISAVEPVKKPQSSSEEGNAKSNSCLVKEKEGSKDQGTDADSQASATSFEPQSVTTHKETKDEGQDTSDAPTGTSPSPSDNADNTLQPEADASTRSASEDVDGSRNEEDDEDADDEEPESRVVDDDEEAGEEAVAAVVGDDETDEESEPEDYDKEPEDDEVDDEADEEPEPEPE